MPKAVEPTLDAHETLWDALLAAQTEFGVVARTAEGQAGRNIKYAPLDVVIGMARPILNRHGLILTQITELVDGGLIVHTKLIHAATGDVHEAAYPVGPLTLPHQQLGAGLTYARRYSLLAILGVHPENEDDDGEGAGPAGVRRQAPPAPPKPRPQPIRAQALPFIDNAKDMLKKAAGSEDAVWAAFDAIKAKEGWPKLNEAEQNEIHRARLAAMPPEPTEDEDRR